MHAAGVRLRRRRIRIGFLVILYSEEVQLYSYVRFC
jgi:hypothetical protein